MGVAHRQTGEGIGIHHLLGAYDLKLIGISVQPVLRRQAAKLLLEAFDYLKAPVRIAADQFIGHGLALCMRRRNTG